jgi:putative ABC transport system permease protein
MNSMWIAVRERTQEVGTLRAIGMGRERVLLMFMTEAVLLGLAATTVGALVGAVLAVAIDHAHLRVPVDALQKFLMSDTLHVSVRPAQLLEAIGVFTFITALSALWPALRAARMQPVTAIQRVG